MMDIAIERTHHIHARLVIFTARLDPRRGSGLAWTEPYEWWWDRIIETQLAAGCPEYGPPPYAPADPDTNGPYSHPWDLSLWAMDRLGSRWSERLAA